MDRGGPPSPFYVSTNVSYMVTPDFSQAFATALRFAQFSHFMDFRYNMGTFIHHPSRELKPCSQNTSLYWSGDFMLKGHAWGLHLTSLFWCTALLSSKTTKQVPGAFFSYRFSAIFNQSAHVITCTCGKTCWKLKTPIWHSQETHKTCRYHFLGHWH